MDNYYSFIQEEDEEGIFYYFITKDNIVYTAYFKIDEYINHVNDFPLLLQNGYAFGFRKTNLNNSKNLSDKAVFQTIIEIMKDFFNSKERTAVLLYHCDYSDEKQTARSRLFNIWASTVSNNSFEKHDVEVVIGKISYHLGFITSIDNPSLKDLRNEFDSFSYHIIQGK